MDTIRWAKLAGNRCHMPRVSWQVVRNGGKSVEIQREDNSSSTGRKTMMLQWREVKLCLNRIPTLNNSQPSLPDATSWPLPRQNRYLVPTCHCSLSRDNSSPIHNDHSHSMIRLLPYLHCRLVSIMDARTSGDWSHKNVDRTLVGRSATQKVGGGVLMHRMCHTFLGIRETAFPEPAWNYDTSSHHRYQTCWTLESHDFRVNL